MARALNRSMECHRWATSDAGWLSTAWRHRRCEGLGTLGPALALATMVGVFAYSTAEPMFRYLIAVLTIAVPR
jgi:hypothetical protein